MWWIKKCWNIMKYKPIEVEQSTNVYNKQLFCWWKKNLLLFWLLCLSFARSFGRIGGTWLFLLCFLSFLTCILLLSKPTKYVCGKTKLEIDRLNYDFCIILQTWPHWAIITFNLIAWNQSSIIRKFWQLHHTSVFRCCQMGFIPLLSTWLCTGSAHQAHQTCG